MAKASEAGRLTEREMRVLIALARGPRHAYAIMKEITQDTGGRIRLGSGSMYAIFDKLAGAGLIEDSRREGALSGEDRRRRYLRLTEAGREVVAAEVERLEELARHARRSGLGERESQRGQKRDHILGIAGEPVAAGTPDASENLDRYVYGSP